MKRILAVMLMGISTISLVACGSTQNAVSEEVTTAAEEGSAEATEDDREAHENTKEGRDDGVKISPFRAGDSLLHVARIM